MRNLLVRGFVTVTAIAVCLTFTVAAKPQTNVQFRVILPDLPAYLPDASVMSPQGSAMVAGSPLICGYTRRTDRPGVNGFSASIYDHSGVFIDPANTYLGTYPATNFWDGYELVGPPEEWCKNWDDPTAHESHNQLAFYGINSNGRVCGLLWSETATPHSIPIYLDLHPLTGILELNRIPLPVGAAGGKAWAVNENGEIAVRLYDLNGSDIGPYIYKPPTTGNKEERIEIPALAGKRFNSGGFSLLWQFHGPENGVERYTLGSATLVEETTDYKRFRVDSASLETFPELASTTGLNRWGAFAGHLRVSKGKNKGEYGVRYGGTPASEERRWKVETGWATNVGIVRSVNDLGDVVGNRRNSNGDYTYYYHEGGPGSEDDVYLPNVMDLVEPASDPDYEFRFGQGSDERVSGDFLTDSDLTGYGWLIGRRSVGTSGARVYLLQPVIPGQSPGLTVSPNSDLVTTEDGGSDIFNVVLHSEPTADVTIGISSSNTAEGTVDTTIITFTPADWDTPQTVTITGVDDANEDGDVAYSIITSPAASDDPAYDGLDAADVSVTNVDNDGQSGGGSTTYSSGNIDQAIPDRNSGGTSHTIGVTIDEAVTIISLTVTLDISHQRPSDLTVTLTGPDGTVVPLSNFSGDNVVTEFNGDSTVGPWTIKAVDSRRKRTGTINSWSITAEY